MTHDFIRITPVSSQLIMALRAAITFLALCGLLYPGVATFLGGLIFPYQATGSLLMRNSEVVGSVLIGQPFTSPQYFSGRPSAVSYNPLATGGSNLAPSNPALRDRARADSLAIQQRERVSAAVIPVDMITTSGSGLDPHISIEAAFVQAPRVAAARGVALEIVREEIDRHTQGPQWGVFGETRVSVLELNLALDALP